jgi:hypothetical protein
MDPLTTIDHAITLARRLREISKNMAEAEFKNVLADLSNELADAKGRGKNNYTVCGLIV